MRAIVEQELECRPVQSVSSSQYPKMDHICRRRRQADRRTQPRTATETGIRVIRAGQQSAILHGELLDASLSGLRMLFEEQLDVGDSLMVEVRTDERVFGFPVHVMWIETNADGRFLTGVDLQRDMLMRDFNDIKGFAGIRST